MKQFYERQGVGSSKYIVNYHDGEQKHHDGSPFFDVRIFKNKVKKNKFVKELRDSGYEEK